MNSNNSDKKSNFIVQAGILAAAGIIVRIIGLLYTSPLTAIIGDEGNGYYSFAYNMYANILLISSYSIPSAIAKIISQKLALRQYRNAHRILKCAFVYVAIVGGLASAFAYFAAALLVVDNAVPVLRVFAPTIFLSGFLGVLRGYFQAHKSMVPTSLSQIIEQLMNAFMSIGAALLFINLAGEGIDETTRAIKGATGSAVGTGSGVLIALIFMAVIMFLNKDRIRRNIDRDMTPTQDSYWTITKDILLIVTPFILSTFIYNCSSAVNQTVYAKVMLKNYGMSQAEISTYYGIFSRKAIVLRNVPIALASAMSSAIIPTISEACVLKDFKGARRKVYRAIKSTMIVAVPCVFGFLFLAKPIVQVLFPQKSSLDLASYVLMGLAVTIVFYCLSTITNGVLQSIGQVNKPVIHASAALGIQFVVLYVLLKYTSLNLFALVIADVVYSFIMCLLNQLALRKYLKYDQEFATTFVLPAICSLVMGGFVFGIYKLVYHFLPVNIVCLLIAVILGAALYFVMILQTRTVRMEELANFPKGKKMVKLVTKLNLVSDNPRLHPSERIFNSRKKRKRK